MGAALEAKVVIPQILATGLFMDGIVVMGDGGREQGGDAETRSRVQSVYLLLRRLGI